MYYSVRLQRQNMEKTLEFRVKGLSCCAFRASVIYIALYDCTIKRRLLKWQVFSVYSYAYRYYIGFLEFQAVLYKLIPSIILKK